MRVYQQNLQCKDEANHPKAIFLHYSKKLHINSPNIITKQNYPTAKFFQTQSKPIQTTFTSQTTSTNFS